MLVYMSPLSIRITVDPVGPNHTFFFFFFFRWDEKQERNRVSRTEVSTPYNFFNPNDLTNFYSLTSPLYFSSLDVMAFSYTLLNPT